MAQQDARRTGSKDKPLSERLSAEALEARVSEERRRQPLRAQAEQLALDEEALQTQLTQDPDFGSSRQHERAVQRRQLKLQARRLRLLERDDQAVLQILERERRIDCIIDGSQPTEVDEML